MLRYLALGDSYTIGEGVPATARWPSQLAAALRATGIAIAEPRVIAATGWTTGELMAAIDAAEPLGQWDLVSLLIGVNNQYRGRDVHGYADEYAALLQRAVALAGDRPGRVLALSIPDWGATRFGRESGRDLAQVARELDAYNATSRALCATHGVRFVDITGIGRADPFDPSLTAEDGLHPSPALYAAWTRQALPAAQALLVGD